MSQGAIDRIAERERVAKYLARNAKPKKFKPIKRKTAKQAAAAKGELGSLDDLTPPKETDDA
jgi:hypothetical protein